MSTGRGCRLIWAVCLLNCTADHPILLITGRWYGPGILLKIMKRSDASNRETGNKKCREIAPGVYYMEAGKGISRSNVFFVRSGSGWVLIDAASADCGQLIRESAEFLFGAGTRPASILLTHDHPDHAGSALELARVWDCPVYVHPDELPLATGDISTFEKYANPMDRWIILPLFRAMPRRQVESMISKSSLKGVVRAFDPGAAVPGLPGWECIPAPGHTPGQVAFFRRRDRVLITGDAVVTVNLNSFRGFLQWSFRRNRQEVSGPPRYSTWDQAAAKKSVAVLAELKPRVLAPGHGMPVAGDMAARELLAFAERFSGPITK
jgi:glyoxylase-like metal-dependent hydrolase (beta-lactamase superfamily II)